MLTPNEIGQLVSLRLGLEDALSQARRASRYRRGAAIVALDAVVERASSIVAFTRGVTVPTNGKLEDLISRLRESLKSSWTPTVLPDIRHLRRARNAAQHEGLEPDRDQVPVWANAVEVYVVTLIAAQYSIDIRRVVLADAIDDGDLRNFIREAEEAREDGDYRRSVDLASRAYSEALSRWRRLRSSSLLRACPSWTEILDRKAFDHMHGELNALQTTIDAATFSGNAADAEWFAAAIAEQGDVLDSEDTERIVTFAFEWVTEYERAASAWTPNRRHRANIAARLVRSHDGPASVAGCETVELRHKRIYAVFRIADVPNEDLYPLWSHAVHEILSTKEGDVWWSVGEDGTIGVDRPTALADDFAGDANFLGSVLASAEDTVQAQQDDAAERDRALRQRRDESDLAIQTVKPGLPSWVQSIEWSNDGIGAEREQWLLVATPDAANLRFGAVTPNSHHDGRKHLMDVIREHPLVEQCYWSGQQGALGLTPMLSAEQLREALADIDVVVRKELEGQQGRRDDQLSALMHAQKGIAASLAVPQ